MGKFSLKKNNEGFKLSEEVAVGQVVLLLEHYDIDIDDMSEKVNDEIKMSVKEAVEQSLEKLTTYVRRGVVEVQKTPDGELIVKQTLISGTVIEYAKMTGKAKLATDRVKGNYAKTYALMGALGNIPDNDFRKMDARDLAVVEILGSVFMNA